MHRARTAAQRRAPAAPVPLAWYALMLAHSAQLDPSAAFEFDRVLNHVKSQCGVCVRPREDNPVVRLGETAQFIHITGEIARTLGDEHLGTTIAAAFGPLHRAIVERGRHAAIDRPVPAQVLAQLSVAASTTGFGAAATAITRQLTTSGFGAQRPGQRRCDQHERSWIALALLAVGAPLDGLDELLAPEVPAPPDAWLGRVDFRRNRLALETSEGRSIIDAPAVGLLLDRALDALSCAPPALRPPQWAAECVVALSDLDHFTGELVTREFADRQIGACLERLVSLQRDDGSFPCSSAKGAPAMQLQDLALTGTALAIGLARAQRPAVRTALQRLRDHVIDGLRSDQPPQALHPAVCALSVADEPSLRTRAALARFLSALISVESSAAFLIRELDLARSILVEIGRGVADQNAIDAMGSEEALHIAVALADCAVSLGDHLAQKLARAIVTAVASRMLGSGAIPAGVLDRGGHADTLSEPGRVEVWPISLSAQLLFVLASATARTERDAAARTLAFAVLHLVDQPRALISTGYDRRGCPVAPRSGIHQQDVPIALRAVARCATGLGLRVPLRRGTTRSASSRSLNLLRSLRGDGLNDGSLDGRIARVQGDAVIAIATLDLSMLRLAEKELGRIWPPAARRRVSPATDGTSPPDRVISQLATVGLQLARQGFGLPSDYASAARQALHACGTLAGLDLKVPARLPAPAIRHERGAVQLRRRLQPGRRDSSVRS